MDQPQGASNMFVLPKWLVGRGLQCTLACKGDTSLEKELSHAGVDMQQTLLLDCRDFQYARYGVEWQWGTSTRVLNNIMRTDRASAKIVFNTLCKNLARNSENT